VYSGFSSNKGHKRRLPLNQYLRHLAFSALGAAKGSRRPTPPPLDARRSFLLLQYSAALGSAVHATPLIPALRAAAPAAEIVVCASGIDLAILRSNPDIDRLVSTPDPTQQFWPAVRAIRAARPLTHPFATLSSTSNRRVPVALAAALAGAGNFVGFTLAPELARAPIVFDDSLSQIANNLRLISALGHPPSAHFEPQIFFSEDDLAHARTLIARFDDPTRPLAVFVTQTSRMQLKDWRPERFAAAAEALIARHDANILLVGAAAERPSVEQHTLRIGDRARNLAGETNLPQLAALLSLCDVGLTVDTGILHVGRAVGLPMVVVAPAWSPPHEWLPFGNPRYIILKNLDLPIAPPDYIIDEVSVDEVTEALDRLLAKNADPK
jgi:ADP-heptose:LPS heptosyltransferase